MSDTSHGRKRRSQRSYTTELIELFREFGAFRGDRQTPGRRDAAAVVESLSRPVAKLLPLLDKGGGTAVSGDRDQLVTVLNPDTHRRPRRRPRRAARHLHRGLIG